MKRAFVVIGLCATTLVLSSCSWQSYLEETVTHFSLTNESVTLVEGIVPEKSLKIVVRSETTDENHEGSSVMLAEGELANGRLALTRQVTEPTKVVISMNLGSVGEEPEVTAVLRPNTTIEFVLIHDVVRSKDYYKLRIMGIDQRSMDQKSRFSITGDLSQQKTFSGKLVYVSLHAKPSLLDGSGETIYFGSVVLDEGKFLLDGDLEGPTLFTVEIFEIGWFGEVEIMHAILEPGVNYSVVPLGGHETYAVRADRDSLHSQLVTSWQFDPEFVALVDKWKGIQNQSINWNERKARAEYNKHLVDNYQVADQCEHVILTDDVMSEFIDPFAYAFETYMDQVVQFRSESLRKILLDTQDPALARMIFELSWRTIEEDETISDRDEEEKISTLSEWARRMDEDYVDQHVTPYITSAQKNKSLEVTNKLLIPGQVAPSFTLTDIHGDEVSLADVLKENKLVLVDFWASWCGPCIASFPALKELYVEYKDQGFEIITISTDDSLEDWENASAEQDLPWIDLGDSEEGEMNSTFDPTATAYGVRFIPSMHLIDGAGCILHKQFGTQELENMLSSLLD